MEEEKDKSKLRLISNQKEEEKDRLRFYHDITYYNINNHNNTNTNNNIKINSKLIFDINNERTRKLLGLDDTYFFYNDNDNFSTAIWKEQRYIIANPLLREFINICWSILGLVFLRMGETYVYKLWPYEKVDIANSIALKINELNLSALYKKWCDKLFGHYRFTQHNFSQLLARKNNFKKLDKGTQKEQLEYAKNLVKSYDNGIKENYKIIMSEKYAAIRDKYKVVVKPLLDIVYPDFVKEIIAYH